MKSEKGFSLIEVVIAIALLGIVAVAFLGALATGSRVIFIADERATAESLARTQMEYVRNQDYSDAPWNYDVTSITNVIQQTSHLGGMLMIIRHCFPVIMMAIPLMSVLCLYMTY